MGNLIRAPHPALHASFSPSRAVLNSKSFEHECCLGVYNSPPWSRRGSRSRRRRRGGWFKVAQHPYGFPRSAPNSIRYLRTLNQTAPTDACGAVAPPCPRRGITGTKTKSPFVSSILLIVLRTGLCADRQLIFHRCNAAPGNLKGSVWDRDSPKSKVV